MTDYVRIGGRNICKRWLANHPEAYPNVPRDASLAAAPEEPLDDAELGGEEVDAEVEEEDEEEEP